MAQDARSKTNRQPARRFLKAEKTALLPHGVPRTEVAWVEPDKLRPNPHNSRVHSKKQIRKIADCIAAYGFLIPVLATRSGELIAGHACTSAALLLNLPTIPVIYVDHLSEDQVRAFIIAANKLAELSDWSPDILAKEFEHFLTLEGDFDISITGFEPAEIDQILNIGEANPDGAEDITGLATGPAVSQIGDVWKLGRHTIACLNALEEASYERLMGKTLAHAVITDQPFGVRVNGHVSGKGKIRHREFVMGSGEQTPEEFSQFLLTSIKLMAAHSVNGSLHYLFMDWAHLYALLEAGMQVYRELKGINVWVKNNGGMGSLYRSRHELVAVFKHGTAPHQNHIQLGRFGRNRTNVWEYDNAATFSRNGDEGDLRRLHPCVKPTSLLADAMLDCTARGNVILDPFLGSGSTLIAAERVGRICFGMDLDPLYTDTAIRRWQRHAGDHAIHVASGDSFDKRAAAVSSSKGGRRG